MALIGPCLWFLALDWSVILIRNMLLDDASCKEIVSTLYNYMKITDQSNKKKALFFRTNTSLREAAMGEHKRDVSRQHGTL